MASKFKPGDRVRVTTTDYGVGWRGLTGVVVDGSMSNDWVLVSLNHRGHTAGSHFRPEDIEYESPLPDPTNYLEYYDAITAVE